MIAGQLAEALRMRRIALHCAKGGPSVGTAGDLTADTGLLGTAPGLAGGLFDPDSGLLDAGTGLLVAVGLLEELGEVQLQRPHVFAQKPFGFAELVVAHQHTYRAGEEEVVGVEEGVVGD
ncbi:TPA: hypothetical protein ACH3X1_010953 [Trebouxia sp. C0004]